MTHAEWSARFGCGPADCPSRRCPCVLTERIAHVQGGPVAYRYLRCEACRRDLEQRYCLTDEQAKQAERAGPMDEDWLA